MSVKKQLLDPLGTLCKLISLNFNEKNTKMSIHNHVLVLQNPEDYMVWSYNYQPVMRMVKGDSKENISEIYYVIIRIIKWYLVDLGEAEKLENWMEIANCEEIRRLIKYTCTAIRKLQETYEFGNVVLAVQFYINILEDALNGNYNDEKLPNYIIENEKEFENLLDYEKIKNFWDYNRLKRVCELYDDCFKIKKDNLISKKEQEILIEGKLKIIKEILELTDSEFQKLIKNSSKG